MADGSRCVTRDGAQWRLGTAPDVSWITDATSIGLSITSAVPPVFDSYATIVLPEQDRELARCQDRAVIALLSQQSPDQPWWLGYLDTGASDVVFPDAPQVSLYEDWPYVLVQAGPEQAVRWRGPEDSPRCLPDLIFPADRSWLVSTLWDDDWACVGGPSALVDRLLGHPDLKTRVRRVNLDEDATPPGHQAI
jgi:hypothetical protein